MEHKIDIKKLKERYSQLYSEKAKNFGLWDDIAKYCRIEKKYNANKDKDSSGQQIDDELNDPSALLSINASANNLYGILIGNGDFFNLNINEELKEELGADFQEVQDYIKKVGKRVLKEINKPESNFKNCIQEHLKDQQTFGTSGLGTFINDNYIKGKSNTIFEFVPYGIDNITIDESRSGIIDTIFVDYSWRINKIVGTFCYTKGIFDEEKFNRLPEKLKNSYKNKPNDKYNLQFCIIENTFFKKGVEGKIGCKYIGVWYLPDVENYQLDIEYFKDLPINIVRVDKIRGELYGRADGTKLISFIKMLNYCMSDTIMAIDKMVMPAKAVIDGSLTGDKVIDTTPGSATVVKMPTGINQVPIFNLEDVKDISPLINVLLPYLKEAITTGFKVDVLLDSNNQTAKTATEMIQRYNIRSKLLYSIVYQQVNELLIPLINYCIKIMFELGELGETQRDPIKDLNEENYLVIPDIIQRYIREDKEWYIIEFNTEISKMAKSGELENISQLLQFIGSIAQFQPNVLQTVDWYKIISRTEFLLNNGESYLISKNDYEDIIASMQQAQAQQMELQNANINSQTQKNLSGANKENIEALNGYNR